MLKNKRPVVASLLSKLQKAGYTLVSAEGLALEGTERDRRQQAKKYICSSKTSYLHIENSEAISKWLYLDLTQPSHKIIIDSSLDSGLETIFDNFRKQWTP